MRFNILAQNSIDSSLIPAPLPLKEVYNVRINTERYLLFCSGPENGLLEKVVIQLRNIRCIDILILHSP